MKFSTPQSLQDIAAIIRASYVGDPMFPVTGMNEIHVVTPGDIVFVDHPKYYEKALNSAATIVLINKKVPCPKGKALLISDDPFRDFNLLSKHFKPFIPAQANIATTAQIGEHTLIQPQAFIGNYVTIGKHCVIHPNVVIYDHSTIGDHVIIHAGTVIGADAFYYKNRDEGHDKLVSTGTVSIENHVEIGALCTIDKGVTGITTIGAGTKLDNQVHIGHDTVIGKHCLIASQTGVAGCVIIEDRVTLWGQVGTTSGITIGEKAVVMGQTGVTKINSRRQVIFRYTSSRVKGAIKTIGSAKTIAKIVSKQTE